MTLLELIINNLDMQQQETFDEWFNSLSEEEQQQYYEEYSADSIININKSYE